jgi:acylpyruvate hydrolase
VKILCVGRNYPAHAKEMGGTGREEPVWFWKPESAIVGDGEAVAVPPGVGAVHHEVELAVRVGRSARRVAPAQALRHLDAATVAVDVTARDLQLAAKKAGNPWAQSKGYDTFLPLGEWQPLPRDLQAIQLRLKVNGQVRQDGSTASMTWGVDRLLAAASAWTTLEPGDVLLTGTPEGVGPIAPGDAMEAEAAGLARLRNPVVAG